MSSAQTTGFATQSRVELDRRGDQPAALGRLPGLEQEEPEVEVGAGVLRCEGQDPPVERDRLLRRTGLGAEDGKVEQRGVEVRVGLQREAVLLLGRDLVALGLRDQPQVVVGVLVALVLLQDLLVQLLGVVQLTVGMRPQPFIEDGLRVDLTCRCCRCKRR